MAEQAGKTNQVWVLAGSTPMTNATGAKMLGVDASTYGQLCDLLDITSFGDTYKKRIAGLLDCKVACSGNLYVGDTTGQAILIAGNSIMIGVYPSGTTVAGSQINAIVESYEQTSDVAGKQTFKATFQTNGAPVALPLRP
jgi:hypothetical protein